VSDIKLTIVQVDLRGRRVFLRADFNVPLAGDQIADDTRIRAVVPTIECCVRNGASVVLASHLGRPQGREAHYSLKPVAVRLGELLGQPVPLAPDCVGPVPEKLARALQPGQCLLLENLRFHPEEEANDPAFAQALARLADCYVNDAFSVSHRTHASVVAITRFLRPAAAGLLMQRELVVLDRILEGPRRPLVLILGGARMSDKVGIVRSLVPQVDRMLIGGAMAFTFLKALGRETGRSPVELDLVPTAKEILADAGARGIHILLPEDFVAAVHPGDRHSIRCVPADRMPVTLAGLDIGPATVTRFRQALQDTGTVVWNGPMGVVEHAPFAAGTEDLAKAVANAHGLTVAAGGDTVAAVRRAGVADKLGYLSPSGAAFLKALEGRPLPGVAALSEANYHATPAPG
jgi:phosphoglycerate kinase